MGGKHKQAQRTKNNARPSSSGRSAELLGSNLPQFPTFSCTKDINFSLTGLSIPEEFDSSIDSNFQLVLKKMNKKDATTKLKALQEFADLVKSAESDAVVAVLPFWPRLYSALATDAEHRVREAVHLAHHQVVLKVKRNIAPFLKQLAGPWFTSQYDTYPPAAYAAKISFESAFPANKLQEAIIFCQEEILSYICDNIIVQTAQTVGNPKTTSTEDLEAKYERVIISSLQGYTLYLNKVNIEAIQKSQELNEQLVLSSKFWKLPKHKLPPIRAAWFETLTAICMKAPFLLEKNHSQLITTVFTSLSENEPTVLPRVWEAVLLTITKVPEWATYINIDKMFMPKLWKILREGGQGSASVIYRNFLPLISHLPSDIDFSSFYSNFFENMRVGLKQKTVLSSRSETSAVATSMTECLQYIIMKNQSDYILCEKLIKFQLIPLIEWCLIENQAASKLLFGQIAMLVQYWNRSRNNGDFQNYPRYLNYFWSNVNSLIQGLLMNYEYKYEAKALHDYALKEVEFLLALKQFQKPKKQMKVSFETSEVACINKDGDKNTTPAGLDEHYLSSLNKLVYEVCESYVKFISEKQSKELIEHLYTLVHEFESYNFFTFLKVKLASKNENAGFLEIYKGLFSKWLKSAYLTSASVVDLIFLLIVHLDVDEKKYVLDELLQLNNEETFSCCVAKALSHPYSSDACIIKWLQNDKISSFLVKIVSRELVGECSSDLILVLKQSFNENDDGELLITKTALEQIIDILSESILEPEKYPQSLDACISLAAYISATIYSEKLALSYNDKLLLSLFSFTCKMESETDDLSKDTLWEATTAWQDAICTLLVEMDKESYLQMTSKIADMIETIMFSTDSKHAPFNNIVNKIAEYLRCSKHLLYDVTTIFLNRNFIPNLREKLVNICIYSEFVAGRMSFPYKNCINLGQDIVESELEEYFTWKNLMIKVLVQSVDEIEEDEIYVKIYEQMGTSNEIILDVLYDLGIGELLLNNYNNLKHYHSIKQLILSMKSTFSQLQSSDNNEFEQTLLNNILQEKFIWPKVSYLFYKDCQPDELPEKFTAIINAISNENNMGKLHALQIYGPHLSYDNVNCKLDQVEKIIALRNLMHCDGIDVQIGEVFSIIVKLKNEVMKINFHDVEFSNWESAQIIIEIIHLFATFVEVKKLTNITAKYRDFIFISLASWCTRMVNIKNNYSNFQVLGYISAVLKLFCSVDKSIKNLAEEDLNSTFVSEWKDVFAQSVHTDVIKTWFYFSAEFNRKLDNMENIKYLPLFKAFGNCLPEIENSYIFKNPLETMPKWSKLLKSSLPLLLNANDGLQLWGYHMLMAMTSGLVEVDSVSVTTNTPHQKGLILEQFKETLIKTQDIVQTMLLEFKLGEDSCRVEPHTDSYTYTFAYFTMWDILLTLCEKANTELNYQYSDWLRKEDLLNNLLNHIFKLMPIEVFNEIKSKELMKYFTTRPEMDLSKPSTSENLEHLICWVYSYTLLNLPASVRQWWANTDTRTAHIVERLTSDYLSAHLCNQELSAVAQHETTFKKMVIKVLKSIRTVKAIYTVDEAQMELLITLPTNYPLGGPDVQCNREIGGSSHKQWLMQLKMCVLHQNGRIWDGLSLWNHNLDKKFDGVEECYICFAVLHPGTYQLPKLSCHTCRKKFHSACLYKWFSTSNKSTCPICRNLF